MTSPVGASAGGRFRLSAPPPGEPDGTSRLGELVAPGEPGTPPSPRAHLPGEPARRTRSLGRPPRCRHRGTSSEPPAAAVAGVPTTSTTGMDRPLHRLRSRLVNPVGPPQAAPFLGSRWRALSGTRHMLRAASPQVKAYFRTHRVIHRTFPQSPRTAAAVHRTRTPCSQALTSPGPSD